MWITKLAKVSKSDRDKHFKELFEQLTCCYIFYTLKYERMYLKDDE